MKREYFFKSIVVFAIFLFSQSAIQSQSFTLSTWHPADTVSGFYLYDEGATVITFNIENTKDTSVILTQVEMIMNYASFFSGTIPTLWYSATSLAGPSTITVMEGWTVISTGLPVYITSFGYYPLFQNLAFTIPAHTQYRFALESTKGFKYGGGQLYNTYENNGVFFKVGSAHSESGIEDTVGYVGLMPGLTEYSTGFFDGRITLEPASTTPVTLLNLTAAYNKSSKANIINWQTAQEINSSHFVLQKAYTLPQFTNVATIPAAGNSSTQKNYHYTDNAVQYKPTYYRLQQTDKDGRYTYSNTVQVNPVAGNGITIYPNPAHNSLTLQYSSKAGFTNLIITDMQGRQVQKNMLPSVYGNNQNTINITSLAPGSYVLTLQNKEEVLQSRFVKAQ